MVILENNGEYDLMQLWAIITELGEQLSQNRSMSVSLGGLAGKIKVFFGSLFNLKIKNIFYGQNQALNSQTGFVLRRRVLLYNTESYRILTLRLIVVSISTKAKVRNGCLNGA